MVGSSQDQGGPLPLQHIYTRRNPTPPVAKASSFFSGLTLSTLPTSPDCMPFVSTRSVEDRTTDIPFCRLGDLECTSLSFSNEDHGPLSPAHNNAVFHNGLFYCLGIDGALGVYDHNKKTWSTVLSAREDQLAFEVNQCYQFEWEEKLLSVSGSILINFDVCL